SSPNQINFMNRRTKFISSVVLAAITLATWRFMSPPAEESLVGKSEVVPKRPDAAPPPAKTSNAAAKNAFSIATTICFGPLDQANRVLPHRTEYLFSVAAGVPPAVKLGILPGGSSCGRRRQFGLQRCHSGRQDAALYGSQDGCRYSRKPALNTYPDATVCAVAGG